MANGRLRGDLLRQDAVRVLQDTFTHARVFRGRRGSETQVADFAARIAAADNSLAGRDRQSVIGDSAPQTHVISAPPGSDVQKGDEVWTPAARYRVIAVDVFPGNIQAIAQRIQ